MARIDTLTNFLTDVADAIKEKKGDSTAIPAEDFDTEIANLPSGVDLEDYVDLEIKDPTQGDQKFIYTVLKNKEPLKIKSIKSGVTNLSQTFMSYTGNIDVSELDLTGRDVFGLFSSFKGNKLIVDNTVTGVSGNEFVLTNFFRDCSYLTDLDLKLKVISNRFGGMQYMFRECISIQTLDLSNLDISEASYSISSSYPRMDQFCYGCTSLVNISFGDFSKFDPSKIKGSRANMFANCPNLSNDSLNNILAFCTRFPEGSYAKTLSSIGLSQTQATTCTGLSNWAAAEAAGWTTGY